MEPCNILDMPRIYEIASASLGESDWLHHRVRLDLMDTKNPLGHKWFTNGTSIVLFEPIGQKKCQIHTLGVSRDRGLYTLCLSSGQWMLRNTAMEYYLMFVPKDRLDIRFFLRRLNARKVGTVAGEMLYELTEGDIQWQ